LPRLLLSQITQIKCPLPFRLTAFFTVSIVCSTVSLFTLPFYAIMLVYQASTPETTLKNKIFFTKKDLKSENRKILKPNSRRTKKM